MNNQSIDKSTQQKQDEFKNATITVTKSAVKRLKAVMASDNKGDHFLRMSVEGGGCSGMTYKMDFEKTVIGKCPSATKMLLPRPNQTRL